ncbi:MAG: serine/threonine-protein kinase, partial [Planctomycetota bacterium]
MKDEARKRSGSDSSWFADPDVLLLALKKTTMHWGEVPRISGYDRMVEISRGGQGVVYRARQCSTNRTVAIKVLLDGLFASEENRLRFQREIELVGKLRHPQIVRIYDSGYTSNGRLYYVMEFVEGVSVDDPTLNPAGELMSTLSLFEKVCDAVQHAHQHGIIHRDLKPNNIMVDEGGSPHILDFGLAKIVDEPQGDGQARFALVSRTGQFFGTLAWASPEQIEQPAEQIDIRTDVYSLGVILYQLLIGRLPHTPSDNLHQTI